MAKAVSVVNILPIVFQLLHYGGGIEQLRNCPYLGQISPDPELNRHVICSSVRIRTNETGCLMTDYFEAGYTTEIREDSCGEVEFHYNDKFADFRSQCYCVIDQQVPTRSETLHCLSNALEAIYDFMHLECVVEAIAHLKELEVTTTAPSTDMTITTTITRLLKTSASTSEGFKTASISSTTPAISIPAVMERTATTTVNPTEITATAPALTTAAVRTTPTRSSSTMVLKTNSTTSSSPTEATPSSIVAKMTTLPLPTSTTAKMIPPYATTTTTTTSSAKDSTTAPTRTSSAGSTTLATTSSTAATAVRSTTTLTSTSTLIMVTATAPTIETIRTPATIPPTPSLSITTIPTIPYTTTTTRASTPIESNTTATSSAIITTTATSTATRSEATAAISTPDTVMAFTTSAAVTTTATISSTTTSENGRIMITSTASTTKTAGATSATTIPFSIRATTPTTSAATSLPSVNTTTTSLNATAGATATTSAGTVNTDATQLKTARTSINESSSIGSIAESTMSTTMLFESGQARIRLRQNKTNSRKFKEYFGAQRNRILERAKLKLLIISSVMTIGLLVQLALITLLRKALRQWTENKCGVQSRFLEDMEGRNWKVLPEGIKKTKMKQKRSNARLEQHYNELSKQRKMNHHSLEDIVKLNRSGGTLQKSSLSKGDMGKVLDKKLSAEQSSDEINIDATQSLESKSDSKEGQIKQRNVKESTSLGSKEEFAKPKESSESKSFDSKEELAKPSSSKEGTTKPAD